MPEATTEAGSDTLLCTLNEMLGSGSAPTTDGNAIDITRFALSREAADLLGAFTGACSPDRIIEVGCASGVSTLAMAQAAPGASLVVMDPKQDSHWKGAGRTAIERAQIGGRVELRLERSDESLPALIAEGMRTQFAFIDGWHMLDYAMMEALLVDRMLDVGGLILLHDLWMPALQHFASFWTTNRAYEPVTIRSGEIVNAPWQPEPEIEQREVRLCATTSEHFRNELVPFVDRSILALRKMGEDERPWDAFEEYTRLG
ncbi:MAG: hypothetical protein Phyf2KO_16950 [Phycisphaerales bacterium]